MDFDPNTQTNCSCTEYTTRELTDLQRAETAAKNIVGKRLTYRRTNEAGHV